MPDSDKHHAAELTALFLALKINPSEEQILAIATALHLTISRAYALRITEDVARQGFTATGSLDPFIDASLQQRALTSARDVTDTFKKWRAGAERRGVDLEAWQQNWARERSIVVDAYEEGLAGSRAARDFYRNNPHIEAMVHVEPEDAMCEECNALIDLGSVPVNSPEADEIFMAPLHLHCAHSPAVDAPDDSSSPDDLWAAGLDVS